MFYGHPMFLGGDSQKGLRYLFFSGLSLSHPVDTKADFNLSNILVTLSLIHISLVKNICQQMSSNLISTLLD